MAYTLPTFNLNVNIWRASHYPAFAPDVVTLGCLALGRRTVLPWPVAVAPFAPVGEAYGAPEWLLLPAGTDVRMFNGGVAYSDWVECPAGSGRIYRVTYVYDAGKGFSNEHRVAGMVPSLPWPVPYP
jgi:hypothetical protein